MSIQEKIKAKEEQILKKREKIKKEEEGKNDKGIKKLIARLFLDKLNFIQDIFIVKGKIITTKNRLWERV